MNKQIFFLLLTQQTTRRQRAPARQSQIEGGKAPVLNEERHCQRQGRRRRLIWQSRSKLFVAYLASGLIALIFLSACQQSLDLYVPSKKEQLADEIIKNVAIQLKKEQGLYPCGSGGGMMDQIKMLALSFNYYKPIEIEEGRQLLIAAVEKFVTIVNAEKRIRPYLNNYPFQVKNIQVAIYLKNMDGSELPPGKLHVISARRGFLQYDIDDPDSPLLKTIHKETYEEALLKVNTALAKRT